MGPGKRLHHACPATTTAAASGSRTPAAPPTARAARGTGRTRPPPSCRGPPGRVRDSARRALGCRPGLECVDLRRGLRGCCLHWPAPSPRKCGAHTRMTQLPAGGAGALLGTPSAAEPRDAGPGDRQSYFKPCPSSPPPTGSACRTPRRLPAATPSTRGVCVQTGDARVAGRLRPPRRGPTPHAPRRSCAPRASGASPRRRNVRPGRARCGPSCRNRPGNVPPPSPSPPRAAPRERRGLRGT
jgi:hypothetical protein